MKVHLDGARIFNAAIAENVSASAFAAEVDSVMFCLSKGLSCPLGSIVGGSKKFIEKANYCRKRIGGGMRQAGIIAAAGIIALEQMIDRLAEDHLCAKLLAEGLNVFKAAMPSNLLGKPLSGNKIREKTGCNIVAIQCQIILD